MATIDDIGGDTPLSGPPLGGPTGWAAAVRDYIRNLTDTIDATGAWQSYVPTINGCTTSAVLARYVRDGKTVTVTIRLTVSAVSGDVTITLPPGLPPAAPDVAQITARLFDANSSRYVAMPFMASALIYVRRLDLSNGTAQPLTATLPFAWAAGDYIYCEATYETSAA